MSELFAFEVPTSAGKFRIIGPDTLPQDEAERIGQQIARLLPLLVLTASESTRCSWGDPRCEEEGVTKVDGRYWCGDHRIELEAQIDALAAS